MTDKIFIQKLGKKIETFRESIGITRQEFAKKVGISRMQMYRIETGNAEGNPSILVLRKIAKELGISVSELVDIK